MKRAFALLPFAVALVVGCSSGSTDTAANNTSAGSSSTGTSSTPPPAKADEVASKSSSGSPGSKAETPPAPAASTNAASDQAIPADLKHEGYDYEGLANTKPLDMEVKISGANAKDLTGSQTVSLTGVKDGVATYSVVRTGGIEILGSETMALKKDGVYEVQNSAMTLDGPALDLPADPTTGKSWSTHLVASEPGGKIDLQITSKILGKETVKTAAGTFPDALIVEQSGSGIEQGKKIRTSDKQWYVKGIGVVKSDVTTYMPKNQVSKISLEVTRR